jgi:hypothetical protein
MSRVVFDSTTTFSAAAEHFMSVFACDLVKIVSVADKDARDVALHMTFSRGSPTFDPLKHYFSLTLFPGNSSISRREVIFTHARFFFARFFASSAPKTRFCNGARAVLLHTRLPHILR